uniref:Uncharacterized protein n=1 Tax=Ciona savignyi TaxID=51511 RepID=H2YP72_CIOSA
MQQVGYHLAYNPGWIVQCDSRLVPSTEEVPPEHCSYIRPGDTFDETYRKSTFRHYPNQDVNCIKLAKAGFYFLGFRDRVKCYSCGQVHEDIRHNDDLSIPRCHLDDCEHIQATTPLRPAENPAPNLPLPRNAEDPSLIQGAHYVPVAQSASI